MCCWCVEQRTSQYPTIEVCADRSPQSADSRQQGTVAADRAATYGSAADRQPIEPTKYWRNMLTAAGASDKTHCHILNALLPLEQVVSHAEEQ